jgi:excisionase family DNA binding protein
MSTQPTQIDPTQRFRADTERLLTADEVAGILGVSSKWVRNHATSRNPRLPYIAVGRLLRFRLRDVQQFVDKLRRDGSYRRVV